MAIPTWDEFMAPVLRVLLDGQMRRRRELYDLVTQSVSLSEDELSETLNSGQLKVLNRIGWALSYLSQAGALERPARAQYVINDVGRRLLADHPAGIRERHLRVLAGDPDAPHTFFALKGMEQFSGTDPTKDSATVVELDPVEQVETGIARLHADVAADLLTRMHGREPAFFEQAVLDLLMAMGYGGADGKATRTQLSNDGGIDGIVDQDALGLSRIYVQAKRYALDTTVGRPEIQGFVGALHGNQAGQGVFITTARFSSGARGYADSVSTRVVLIDGHRLSALMIRYGVGVQVKRSVTIVEVDEDFFE